MKRDPDRLDFLIVILPILLVGVLGFQVYDYFQMSRQRTVSLPMNSGESPAPRPDGDSGDVESNLAVSPELDVQASDAEEPAGDSVVTDPTDGDSSSNEGELAADTDATAAVGEPGNEAVLAEAAAVPEPQDAQASAPEDVAAVGHAEVLLVPQSNPAKVGELLAVDVLIRDGFEVSGAIFHLRFDNRALQLNEEPQSELGPFFEDPEGGTRFSATVLPNGKVVVSINLALGSDGRSGDGRLMTFYFQVLASGETRLDLLQSVLRDGRNRPLPAVFSNATLLVVD